MGQFDSDFAPPDQTKANGAGSAAALIQGSIPLPAPLGLRSRSWLASLYSDQHLSAREISRVAAASRAGVLNALDRFGIPPHFNGYQKIGPPPFGFDYQGYQLVTNSAEQAAIRMMQERRSGGLSLRKIAGRLNSMLMPTKQSGVWRANTVRVILARA